MMKNEELFKKTVSLLKKTGAKKIAVFGSYARGEQNPKRDIDLHVEFKA